MVEYAAPVDKSVAEPVAAAVENLLVVGGTHAFKERQLDKIHLSGSVVIVEFIWVIGQTEASSYHMLFRTHRKSFANQKVLVRGSKT